MKAGDEVEIKEGGYTGTTGRILRVYPNGGSADIKLESSVGSMVLNFRLSEFELIEKEEVPVGLLSVPVIVPLDAQGRMSVDLINHPPHYTEHPSGVECIDITEHMNFCLGNAMKYIWRAGNKGDAVEDLKKARWYIDREIGRLEATNARTDNGVEKLDG